MPRPTLALALVAALTGCVGAPPSGSLVEYHEGAPPVTRKVTCEATYALVRQDGAAPPIVEHRAVKGEHLGFRRAADGSVVAVAPGYTFPLAPGAYAWEVVPGSVPSHRERFLCETRDRCLTAAKVTAVTVLVLAAIFGALVLVFAFSNGLNYT